MEPAAGGGLGLTLTEKGLLPARRAHIPGRILGHGTASSEREITRVFIVSGGGAPKRQGSAEIVGCGLSDELISPRAELRRGGWNSEQQKVNGACSDGSSTNRRSHYEVSVTISAIWETPTHSRGIPTLVLSSVYGMKTLALWGTKGFSETVSVLASR